MTNKIKQPLLTLEKKTPALSIAAFVFGIISLILGWFPIFGWIFIVLSIVFGVISLKQIKIGNLPGREFAIAGLVLAGVGFVLALIAMIAFASAAGAIKCSDLNCFVAAANDCNTKVSYVDVTSAGTFSYYVESVTDNAGCVLTKEITKFSEKEDQVIISALKNKKLYCKYTAGNFNEKWITSLFEDIENCDGNLKETIAQLLLLS